VPEIFGFMHVNVNCSDLERSRRFYGDALGLVASAHTRPAAPQSGAGFGLPGDALWDAWILDDPRGMGSAAALDLLRWEEPPPVGRPPGVAPATGIHRLTYAVAALDDVLPRLAAAGGRALPIATVTRGRRRVRLAWVLDPDGSVIELVEDPECAGAVQARAVSVVCRDLDRSIAWYRSVLGLEVRTREDGASVPGEAFAVPGNARWDAAELELPGRAGHYALRLERWHEPPTVERAPAVANQLGPFRLAFLVDDAHAWHAELARRGVSCTAPPVWLDMGPEIPIDGLWALFFFDLDGACVEMIQTPQLRG
jgi:catechol 2,3-dioxygenase-like lactoylglutathione lyase family enzyme